MAVSGGDRFLERDGIQLRWRLEGAGRVLVLLHGWALDLGSWDAVTPQLARHFTVLRFDRRGFGLSGGEPDIQRNVEDLRALLDAADIAVAAVLGMSQGARFAIHFALRCADRTSALLLDGAPAIEAESELPLEEYRQLLESDGLDALREHILGHSLMQLNSRDPSAIATLQQCVARYRGRDLLQPGARAHAPDLRRVDCPTLILNGELDSEARRDAGAQLQSGITGASRVELPDAGHLALLDAPRPYAQVITEFVRAAT